jgi:4-coumarate--CoA ligase
MTASNAAFDEIGLPKGVSISHYNLIANVEQTIFSRKAYKAFPSGTLSEERWIGLLPLSHAYGQLYTILMAAKLLAPVYIMTKFDFTEYLRIASTHRITQLQVAPPIMIMLAKRPEPDHYDLRSLESITCGAAPLSPDIQNQVADRFQVPILHGWGMTELTCSAILVPGGIDEQCVPQAAVS